MQLPPPRQWTHNWPLPNSRAASHFGAIWHLLALQAHPEQALSLHVPTAFQRLLKHAIEHSTSWRARVPTPQASLSDLPIIDRAWVREQAAREGSLMPRDPWGESIRNQTSGSSGQPLGFHVSAASVHLNLAVDPMQHILRGRDLARHYTMIATRSVSGEGRPHWPDLSGMLFPSGPSRWIEWMARPIAEIAALLDSVPADGYVSCSASLLSGLCDHYEVEGRPAPAVLEFLTRSNAINPELRARAQRLFGASVADVYSCEEIGAIAHDCAQAPGHYHVLLGNAMVEVVDADGRPLSPGVSGRVLLTGLNSHATPFVRYDIGDQAALLPACACGWAGPTLTDLVGRQHSLLKLPGGGQIYVLLYAAHWLPIAPVREYRLVQDAIDHLHLELVMDKPLTVDQHEAIIAMLHHRISRDFRVTLHEVSRIEWGNGKRNEVVCRVP